MRRRAVPELARPRCVLDLVEQRGNDAINRHKQRSQHTEKSSMSFGDDIHEREPAPDPLAAWPAFAESVRKRLEAGRAAYGDKSFERPPAELVAELQQEALDLAGWGFVLWCRLEAMQTTARTSCSCP